jgi:hypothetical protein
MNVLNKILLCIQFVTGNTMQDQLVLNINTYIF